MRMLLYTSRSREGGRAATSEHPSLSSARRGAPYSRPMIGPSPQAHNPSHLRRWTAAAAVWVCGRAGLAVPSGLGVRGVLPRAAEEGFHRRGLGLDASRRTKTPRPRRDQGPPMACCVISARSCESHRSRGARGPPATWCLLSSRLCCVGRG
jgi:hypothetical protein